MTEEPEMQARTPAEVLGTLTEFEKKYAPEMLYLRGRAEFLRFGPRVSVVGTRKMSDLGRRRAQLVTKELVRRHMVVVSGLAEGIDTIAHTTAIDEGGQTIAVLGTPLDRVYPKSNEALFETIVAEHLAVSQFPLGYPTTPRNFPVRNRTMALLSDATIIVEAGVKSGTEHQGWEATRLGRPLWILENVLKVAPWAETLVAYGAQVVSKENLASLLEDLPQVTSPEALAF